VGRGGGERDLRGRAFSSELRRQRARLPANVARKRCEIAFESAFQRLDFVEVLVEAPTPELGASATSEPAHALETDKARFASVADVSASSFFQRLLEGTLTKIGFGSQAGSSALSVPAQLRCPAAKIPCTFLVRSPEPCSLAPRVCA